MQGMLKSVILMVGAAALAVPAAAQQQGGPPPGGQAGGQAGAQAPRPGGAPPAGQGQPGGPGAGQGQGAGQGRPGGPGGAGGGGGRPPGPPPNTGIPMSAELYGARGSGYAGVVIDPPAGTVCYMLNATIADPPTAAHIHTGGPGVDGPPVVTMANPAGGSSGGCQPIAAPLAQQILANPGGYYVNVHTALQPQGAIRGQLAR